MRATARTKIGLQRLRRGAAYELLGERGASRFTADERGAASVTVELRGRAPIRIAPV